MPTCYIIYEIFYLDFTKIIVHNMLKFQHLLATKLDLLKYRNYKNLTAYISVSSKSRQVDRPKTVHVRCHSLVPYKHASATQCGLWASHWSTATLLQVHSEMRSTGQNINEQLHYSHSVFQMRGFFCCFFVVLQEREGCYFQQQQRHQHCANRALI